MLIIYLTRIRKIWIFWRSFVTSVATHCCVNTAMLLKLWNFSEKWRSAKSLQYPKITFFKVFAVVEISFDKVVSHLFNDFMSFVTMRCHHDWHRAEKFENSTCPDRWKSLSQAPSKIYFNLDPSWRLIFKFVWKENFHIIVISDNLNKTLVNFIMS